MSMSYRKNSWQWNVHTDTGIYAVRETTKRELTNRNKGYNSDEMNSNIPKKTVVKKLHVIGNQGDLA